MKRNLTVVFLLTLSVFFSISCNKLDTTDIGGDLIPAVDNINTFDTVMDVEMDNIFLPDSSRVYATEDHAWGIIENDPEFGRTQGQIYFSVTPAVYGVHPFAKKDSMPIIDSVVLALQVSSTYGDTFSMERMVIHQILPLNSYFTNRTDGFPIDTSEVTVFLDELGTKLIDFTTLNDSVFDIRKRDTLRLVKQLRIHLDNSLATYFMGLDSASTYSSDSAFRTKFRGLALQVDEGGSPNKRALAYFNLAGEKTRLLFYYRVQTPSNVITDTLVTEFAFHTFNFANLNTIRRTPANNYLSAVNSPATNDEKVYLQTSPGSYAKVRIPNLEKLSNRLIHRAELIFEKLPSLEDQVFTTPASLFLDVMDTTNDRIATVPFDFSFGSSSYLTSFGGLLKNNQYIFNISRYVQSIVTRKFTLNEFRLYAPYDTSPFDLSTGAVAKNVLINTPVAAGRVVLAGGNYSAAPAQRARLRIIYSKL